MCRRPVLLVAAFVLSLSCLLDAADASPDCVYDHGAGEISARYQDAAPDGSAMEKRGHDIDDDYSSRGLYNSGAHIRDLDNAAAQYGYTFDCASATYRATSTTASSSSPVVTEAPVVVTANPTTTTRPGATTTSTTHATSTSVAIASSTTTVPTSVVLGATTAPAVSTAAPPTSRSDDSGGPPWPLLVGALAVIAASAVVLIRGRTSTRGLGRP